MGIHAPLPPHRRVAIEAEIALHLDRVDALLRRLDKADGDPDLEDDDPAEPAGDELDASYPEGGAGFLYMVGGLACAHEDAEDDDPAGGNIEDERQGEDRLVMPRYGLDQSRGPTNVQAANNEYHARLNGAVPNGRGGWRWPH